MLNMDDIHFLENYIPFYAHLNMDEQNLLKKSANRLILTKGEYLSDKNDESRGFILVRSGRIRAFILSTDGREITLFRMVEKNVCILSASCLFRNLSFTVYLEVEKEGTIYLIPSTVIDELGHYNMKVKEYLLEHMTSRFSSAMWVMEQAVFDTLPKRIASFLLEQVLLENSHTLVITHEMIAKNIGSAREVVSRMLKDFEKSHILSTSRGKICIYDLEKLKLLAQ